MNKKILAHFYANCFVAGTTIGLVLNPSKVTAEAYLKSFAVAKPVGEYISEMVSNGEIPTAEMVADKAFSAILSK